LAAAGAFFAGACAEAGDAAMLMNTAAVSAADARRIRSVKRNIVGFPSFNFLLGRARRCQRALNAGSFTGRRRGLLTEVKAISAYLLR